MPTSATGSWTSYAAHRASRHSGDRRPFVLHALLSLAAGEGRLRRVGCVCDSRAEAACAVAESVGGAGFRKSALLTIEEGVEVMKISLWITSSVIAVASAIRAAVPSSEYIAIDISGGCSATTYPVLEVESAPQGESLQKYKMNFLLLRRVAPGKDLMSVPSPTNRHEVVISKPYYIGVFEITQRQYELITGRNPADDRCPDKAVDFVSWDDIRGEVTDDVAKRKRYEWPVNKEVFHDSFVGRLRAKTSCEGIDLPTESQWVNACLYGMSENALGVDACGKEVFDKGYVMNVEATTLAERVGLHLPNKIGIYDMHGNVYEWCLDKFSRKLTEGKVDPIGTIEHNHEWYVLRGGTVASMGKWYRMKYLRYIGWNLFGFRIVLNTDEP